MATFFGFLQLINGPSPVASQPNWLPQVFANVCANLTTIAATPTTTTTPIITTSTTSTKGPIQTCTRVPPEGGQDWLGSEERLLPGGRVITAPNGIAKLQLQADGNLVVTCTANGAQVWTSNTGNKNVKVRMRVTYSLK